MTAREQADGIAATLRAAGHQALLAGGCVRDLLLGTEPKDFDIATSARPDEVQALFRRTVPVGAAFGVILVLPDGETPFEVATFRKDLGYTDRRRPDAIAFTDAREDARRRDFTINGLFLEPATGKVLDYVDGRADLERRLIRAIGDPNLRIEEDRLRMLRAVRFAARLNFAIDTPTLEAVRRHASTIVDVSAERIRDELTKMLTAGDAPVALRLLEDVDLLRVILPEVSGLKGSAPSGGPTAAASNLWDLTLLRMAQLRQPLTTLALAALLLDIGYGSAAAGSASASASAAELATEILTRLKFSNEVRDQIVALVRHRDRFDGLRALPTAARKRVLREPRIEEHLELYRADRLAAGSDLAEHAYAASELAALTPADRAPERLLTGRDLVAMGLRPGPEFSRILTELEDAQLDGRVTDRDQALDHVRSLVTER